MLAPVSALLGRWVGEGHAHGEPASGTLELRAILDGTVVEARESVGAHEDLCLYRWDAASGQLRVLHAMAGEPFAEHPVELLPGGLCWVTPPGHPAVEWWLDGGALRCDVTWPGADTAEVSIRYTRAGDARE